MPLIGLKLWSTNKHYFNEAQRLVSEGTCDYIELFAEPGSFKEFAQLWKNINVEFVIHAAHSVKGLNLSKIDQISQNMSLIHEAQQFADCLNAEKIIFHPGYGGTLENVITQLLQAQEHRAVIENMPGLSLDGKPCIGFLPEEIKEIQAAVPWITFCLDVAHAIYAANTVKLNQEIFLKSFFDCEPVMLHLSDGNWLGVTDDHKNFGQGSFKFDQLAPLLSSGKMISLETQKNYHDSLKDFEEDVAFLVRNLRLQSLKKGVEEYDSKLLSN